MRKLMWFTIGFAAACFIGVYLYPADVLLYAAVAFAFAVTAMVVSRWWRILRVIAAVITGVAVGISWFYIYDSIHLKSAHTLDNQTIQSALTVSDYSYATKYGSAVSAQLDVDGKKYNVLVYLKGNVICQPGDCLNGTFRYRFTSEGGMEEPTYHRSEGVFLLAYQSGDVIHMENEHIPNRYLPAFWRVEISRRIETLFPARSAAFSKALLLGDRTDIDYETNTAFKITGISHIVAVSGLHVSILFGIVYFITGRKSLWVCLLGIPLLVLFAAITGFSPSINRACIMQVLMLLAMVMKREYDAPTALAFSALVMMIVNPMVIMSISFQLSVGCMCGIFLFYEGIHDWILAPNRLGSAKGKGIIPRMKRWFASSVSVSLSASILTTPLVAYYFGTVSLISILTNLLVVWLVCYIFYGIIVVCALSLFSLYIARLAAWAVAVPIRVVLETAGFLSKLPLSAVYTESIYIVIWLVFEYLLLIAFLCMKKRRVMLMGIVSAVCLIFSLIASWLEPLTDECRLTMLDVGQGQCILLQSEGRTFLVDCGGDSPTESADLAAETLLSQGIHRIDGLIVTHYDEDHAGGVPYLLSRIEADVVFLPDIVDDDGIRNAIAAAAIGNTAVVGRDVTMEYGGTSITIYGPEAYNSGNDSSLCILFQAGNCDILITGDRGRLGELLLMHRTELPDVDVLVAGHHGSAGSTIEELLKTARPEYVLISVGEDNRYGHPAQALLERLKKFGCAVFRTDLHGTILYRG